jgi:hypothetical protein
MKNYFVSYSHMEGNLIGLGSCEIRTSTITTHADISRITRIIEKENGWENGWEHGTAVVMNWQEFPLAQFVAVTVAAAPYYVALLPSFEMEEQ